MTMERKETRELDAKIRRRWAEWETRAAERTPLAGQCARWEDLAAVFAARTTRELIRGIHAPTRQRAIPDDVSNMSEVTPQALLRDLHRPIGQFAISEYDRLETGWDRGGRGGIREIKQTLAARYEIPIESLLRTQGEIREDMAELRRILDLKWEDAPKLGSGATTSSAGVVEVPSFQDELWQSREGK
jgi:hypothetical protein